MISTLVDWSMVQHAFDELVTFYEHSWFHSLQGILIFHFGMISV